jgi:hypothetical protein
MTRLVHIQNALGAGASRFMTVDHDRRCLRVDFAELATVMAELIAADLDQVADQVDHLHCDRPAPLSEAVRLLRARADWLRGDRP